MLSYLTTPWKMLLYPFLEHSCSWTIDENTDTVDLIEGFVLKWNSHTLGSGGRITVDFK